MKNPPLGLRHEATIAIDETLTVPRLPPVLTAMANMPPVFATAYMVGFVEATCIDALAPYLEDDEATVGTRVDMTHTAATPPGLRVTAQVELLSVEKRIMTFHVRCFDDKDDIGEGLHERALITRSRFQARVMAKHV